MTESEIKIWNEAIGAAMRASLRPNGYNRIAELYKPAPEPGDLSEDEMKEIRLGADTLQYGFWEKISRLIAEVRRRRKEDVRICHGCTGNPLCGALHSDTKKFVRKWVEGQPKPPHEHEWKHSSGHCEPRFCINFYRCSCRAAKIERIEEPK